MRRAERPPRRDGWWRQRWVKFVGLLVAVLVLLQIPLHLAVGSMIQARAAQELHAGAVGFRPCLRPLGHDLVQGRLDCSRLQVSDVDVPAAGGRVHVTNLDATVKGLTRVGDDSLRADAIQGTATLLWRDLRNATGADFQGADGSAVRVTASLPLFHENLPVTLEGIPTIDVNTQQLRVLDPVASADGVPVPEDLLSGILLRVSARYPLPSVSGSRWTDVKVIDDGVVLSFECDEVVVHR